MTRMFPALLILGALGSGCTTTTTEDYSIDFSKEQKESSTALDAKLRQLEKLSKEFPKRSDYLYTIAGVYNQKEDLRSAIKALKRAIEIDPNEPKYHYQLGRLHLQIRELDLAESSFRKSLELMAPDRFTGAHGALGYVLCQKGKWEEALKEYETCARIDPKDPNSYYYMGCIHDVLRQKDLAVRNLKEYLRMGGTEYRKTATRILSNYGEVGPDAEGDGQLAPVAGKDASGGAVPAASNLGAFPAGQVPADMSPDAAPGGAPAPAAK